MRKFVSGIIATTFILAASAAFADGLTCHDMRGSWSGNLKKTVYSLNLNIDENIADINFMYGSCTQGCSVGSPLFIKSCEVDSKGHPHMVLGYSINDDDHSVMAMDVTMMSKTTLQVSLNYSTTNTRDPAFSKKISDAGTLTRVNP